MKKIAYIVLSLVIILGTSVASSASQAESVDNLLAPYQLSIDKVNAEVGSTFFIPKKNKEQVYNRIKDKTPKELETMLRREYKTFSLEPYSNKTLSGDGYYTLDDGSGKWKTQKGIIEKN